MTKCGCNKEQKAEIIRQSAEFMAKSHELGEKLEIYAKAGRKEGESLEDFKNRKLKALDIQADAINRLSEWLKRLNIIVQRISTLWYTKILP